MKRMKIVFAALVVLGGIYAFTQKGSQYETLKIGSEAPMIETEMQATSSNEMMSLNGLKGEMEL